MNKRAEAAAAAEDDSWSASGVALAEDDSRARSLTGLVATLKGLLSMLSKEEKSSVLVSISPIYQQYLRSQ